MSKKSGGHKNSNTDRQTSLSFVGFGAILICHQWVKVDATDWIYLVSVSHENFNLGIREYNC